MSVFGKIWNTVKSVIPKIGKVSIIDIGKTVLFAVPEIIEDVTEFVGMAPAEKIDSICDEIRARTGIEEGAVDVIRDLPADKEDLFFDALAVLIEIIAKNRLKVDGYFVPGEPEADFNAAVEYVRAGLSAAGPGAGKAAPFDVQYGIMGFDDTGYAAIIGQLDKDIEAVNLGHAQGHIEYPEYYLARSVLQNARAVVLSQAVAAAQ